MKRFNEMLMNNLLTIETSKTEKVDDSKVEKMIEELSTKRLVILQIYLLQGL